MTLRNPNPSSRQHNSWRHDIVSYRRARLQRSLVRLRTHPAVNPTGPHGPYGRVTSSPSITSSSTTCAHSRSSVPNPAQSPETREHVPSGIIPALFNDLVRRELGIDPSRSISNNSGHLKSYISAARAVTSTPTLSDSRFVTRLASGHDPAHLANPKILSSVVSRPVTATPQAQRARDIHLAIRSAKVNRTNITTSMTARNDNKDFEQLRRSSRKRLRPHGEAVPTSPKERSEKDPIPNPPSGELEAFRPTPESVRRSRSVAARVRRSASNKTSECCFCPSPQKYNGEELESELIGPFVDRRGNAKLFVHFDCACWAPQVYTDPANGQLRRVYDEYCRGRKLKCSSCGEKGATIGCYIQRCKRVFHYRCLERAKAYCVERFFAAYCETHAHLGKKPSYKILMEAATIADVSAAQRKEDTTFGLDAPHSRYTMLRRRETEIIFSRKWHISSHAGAFETRKVVFSHRRKVILSRCDRISVGDCVRVLRTSALDIASGRLAFMSIAEKGEGCDDVSAVEARAAIASRESTGLLLLRNLRKSPEWSRDEIEVVRSIPMDVSKSSPTLSRKKSTTCAETETTSQERHCETLEDTLSSLKGQKRTSLPEWRSTDLDPDSAHKRRRFCPDSESNDDVLSNDPKTRANKTVPSARLPRSRENIGNHIWPHNGVTQVGLMQVSTDYAVFRDSFASGKNPPLQRNDKDLQCKGSRTQDKSNFFASDEAVALSQIASSESRQADAGFAFPSDRNGCYNEESTENAKEKCKVTSAWETFLEEQLPRERTLRPDDSMADSLRNMARLWSLMTSPEREAYEKRGRISGFSPSPQVATERRASLQGSRALTKRDVGLFSSDRMLDTKSRSEVKLQIEEKVNYGKPAPSVSLSTMKQRQSGQATYGQPNRQPNWDELFPTTLESELTRTTVRGRPNRRNGNFDRVRSPPTREKA